MKLPKFPAAREWPQIGKAYFDARWPAWLVDVIGLPLVYLVWPRHFRNLFELSIIFEFYGLIRFIWLRRGGFARVERDYLETRARLSAEREAKAAAAAKSGSEH